VDQAGFRKDRSTGEQVLALTTHIENVFEKKPKTGAVFLDLTAAYDTVWHKGLLLKLTKALRNHPISALQPQVQSSPWTEQECMEKTEEWAPTTLFNSTQMTYPPQNPANTSMQMTSV
jgi:hypothetical protein